MAMQSTSDADAGVVSKLARVIVIPALVFELIALITGLPTIVPAREQLVV